MTGPMANYPYVSEGLEQRAKKLATSPLVAELMPIGGDGLICQALTNYVRGVERSAWQRGLMRAQHVIRYAGLPDVQTKALIDEMESYLDGEMK